MGIGTKRFIISLYGEIWFRAVMSIVFGTIKAGIFASITSWNELISLLKEKHVKVSRFEKSFSASLSSKGVRKLKKKMTPIFVDNELTEKNNTNTL